MDYDKKNGKALVITNSIIDARKFNDSNKYANWADCSLRQWLNGAFYENTFTDNADYGTKVTKPNDPSKTAYTFDYWTLNDQ